MQLDIAIVVFRPDWAEMRETLGSLAATADEFRSLHLLLSGADTDFATLSATLDEFGLAARTTVEHRYDNLGFATGQNRLLRRSFESGADVCLVFNPDIVAEKGALTALVAAIDGRVQSQLMGPSLRSSAQRGTTDSLGIRWTASGRHIDDGLGKPWDIAPGRVRPTAGVTGACMLVSREVHDRLVSAHGYFFDDYFLAYREDAELGIRAGMAGVPSTVIEIEGFSHYRSVRGFQRGNALPDLLGVRNRFLVRWKLGSARPGSPWLPTLRDLIVIASVLTIERSSRPGLTDVWRIRRGIRRRRGAIR